MKLIGEKSKSVWYIAESQFSIRDAVNDINIELKGKTKWTKLNNL